MSAHPRVCVCVWVSVCICCTKNLSDDIQTKKNDPKKSFSQKKPNVGKKERNYFIFPTGRRLVCLLRACFLCRRTWNIRPRRALRRVWFSLHDSYYFYYLFLTNTHTHTHTMHRKPVSARIIPGRMTNYIPTLRFETSPARKLRLGYQSGIRLMTRTRSARSESITHIVITTAVGFYYLYVCVLYEY